MSKMTLRNLSRAALFGVTALTLTACGSILGPSEAPPQIYALDPTFGPVTNAPATQWQIGVPSTISGDVLDTKRITLQRGQVMDYYASSAWSDQAPDLIQGLLVEAFEKSGQVKAVGRVSSGVRADLLVSTELRDFTAHYAGDTGAPNIVVDIETKLITATHHDVVATYTAHREAMASANSVPAVVQAFNQATGQAISDIVSWTLNNASSKASDALPPTTAAPVRHGRRHHSG
jgi:cholesterol transport system auxiliary component